MKILYLDCGMGAAGDMLTAALVELTDDPSKTIEELNSLGIPNTVFGKEQSVKCGITGTHMKVMLNGEEEDEHMHDHDHHHDHEHDHDHHHDHEHEHEHEHHHHHEHGEECGCGHHHDHEHHHHHEHGEECTCGCHDHDHHHHHADEVFTSWGRETAKKYPAEQIGSILEELDSGEYGIVLRAKGIVAGADGKWIHFDFVPGEENVRYGAADVMGRICVIGSKLDEAAVAKLFGL